METPKWWAGHLTYLINEGTSANVFVGTGIDTYSGQVILADAKGDVLIITVWDPSTFTCVVSPDV